MSTKAILRDYGRRNKAEVVAHTIKHLSIVMLLALLTACDPANTTVPTNPTSDGKVVVFAASSLKDTFEGMEVGLRAGGLDKPEYNFAGSQALVTQLSQGARADVFASADARNMEAAITAGEIVTGTQRVLATNRLVFVVPSGPNKVASAIKNLASPGVKLSLAEALVPVGNYSLQALDKLSADPAYGADFKQRILANVVTYENNVRQVLAKVQLGEVDGGIVYMTDARSPGGATPTNGKVDIIDIPEQYNVIARYYIAPTKDATNKASAERFIEYVLSEEGQNILESYGFGPADQGK
ncbi:MAG: molybdate ABC transporter substrate-binding protein [Chloroflexia bacterium]